MDGWRDRIDCAMDGTYARVSLARRRTLMDVSSLQDQTHSSEPPERGEDGDGRLPAWMRFALLSLAPGPSPSFAPRAGRFGDLEKSWRKHMLVSATMDIAMDKKARVSHS